MFKTSRLKKKFIKANCRLRRVVLAEWQQIDMSDPDLYQNLTDAMIYGYAVQINYEGSGWRDIQPYGWNTSKDGNNLLMCYKDNGEVRSYRLDKVLDVYIDYDSQMSMTNNPQMNEDEQTQIYEDIMQDQENIDMDMPELVQQDEDDYQNNNIYDNELKMLRNDDTVVDDNTNYFDNNNNEINNEEFNNNEEVNNNEANDNEISYNNEINNEQNQNEEENDNNEQTNL